jgi:NADPH-dependent FMN reductase
VEWVPATRANCCLTVFTSPNHKVSEHDNHFGDRWQHWEGRFSEKPARWILQQLKKRDDIDARLLDLRDFPMPFFDQPVTPATPNRAAFKHEVVQKWTAAIGQSDGFI